MKKNSLKAAFVIIVCSVVWVMTSVRTNGQSVPHEFKSEFFHGDFIAKDYYIDDDGEVKEKEFSRCGLSVSYPITGEQPLLDSIRTWINNKLHNFFHSDLYDGPLDDGQSLVDFYTPTDWYGRDCEYFIGVTYVSEKLVVCNEQDYVDYGGTHGGCGEESATFRRDNGKILKWDIFKENSLDEVLALVSETLNRDYFADRYNDGGLTNGKNMWGEKLELPRNMPKFTETGIKFQYSEYEIAPWAGCHCPAPWCLIPYEDLLPYMTEEAKLLIE